ncbi:aldose 1-epimerase family protein [Candidatus Bathyarchaeota archaeon]|nr:aldose 1-epimerase family protein [Candidatus Bathyarchaeota archaeon]MBS7613621.1 aldose 1-epimerase family protein [Candidatus Bathyarchaeota archaeon]MBS7617112.1 aldose 1-epimerase family protein [Candidatus Bathyarchaeota archaeon]
MERDVRVVSMKTGEVDLYIIVDRGLDIANAEYKGVPLAWISPTGFIAPSFFEPESFGWLRGFFGGLLTTCGLTYLGAPTVDMGERLGLHGRISYIPAKLTRIEGYWDGEDYIMVVEGSCREARVFGSNLVLKRKIESKLGSKTVLIEDLVVNEGWGAQPLMILYHFNFGFPLVDENAYLISTSKLYVPRDRDAEEEAEKYDRFQHPTGGFREKVYFHDMAVDDDGYVYAAIVNEKLMDGLGVYVKYRKRELNRFIEWKMMGEGTYVVGLEPANCLVLGRDRERKWSTLQFIQPGEERKFTVEFNVLTGLEEVGKFLEKIYSITREAKPKMLKSVEEFVNATK